MSDRYMEKIRMSKLKVAVIGAGAAGMIAAYKAAEFADVTIYEKNEKGREEKLGRHLNSA